MGSICLGVNQIEKIHTIKAPIISSTKDIRFSKDMFIQENAQSFYSMYKLDKNSIGSGAFASV